MRAFALRPAALGCMAATLMVSGMACTGVIGDTTHLWVRRDRRQHGDHGNRLHERDRDRRKRDRNGLDDRDRRRRHGNRRHDGQ